MRGKATQDIWYNEHKSAHLKSSLRNFICTEKLRKNYDIMSAKEKEAAAKQTFTFLAPLTNEQSCEAGRESAIARVREYRVDIITLKK